MSHTRAVLLRGGRAATDVSAPLDARTSCHLLSSSTLLLLAHCGSHSTSYPHTAQRRILAHLCDGVSDDAGVSGEATPAHARAAVAGAHDSPLSDSMRRVYWWCGV